MREPPEGTLQYFSDEGISRTGSQTSKPQKLRSLSPEPVRGTLGRINFNAVLRIHCSAGESSVNVADLAVLG